MKRIVYSLNSRETWQSFVIVLLSGFISYISFSQEPEEAFLFPRLFSICFFVLSWFVMIQTIRPSGREYEESKDKAISGKLRIISPGVIAMIAYVYFLAEWLGFYTSSYLILLFILSFYDGKNHREAMSWVIRFALSTGTITVIYLMFYMLLKVQTPRGVLF